MNGLNLISWQPFFKNNKRKEVGTESINNYQ